MLQDISLYYEAGQLVTDSSATFAPSLLPAATSAAQGAAVLNGSYGPSLTGLGLQLATMAIPAINGNMSATAQRMLVFLCTAPQTVTVSTLGAWLEVAAVTAGTGVNRLALFTEAGVLLQQSADMTTAFQSAVSGTYIPVEGAITSQQLTAGSNYWLGLISNFTGTAPAFGGNANLSVAYPQVNGHYLAGYVASQATVPASFTPSALTVFTRIPFIYAR